MTERIRYFIFSWIQQRQYFCIRTSSCMIVLEIGRKGTIPFSSEVCVCERNWIHGVIVFEWMCVVCVRETGEERMEGLVLVLAFCAKSQLWLCLCILQCELSERWGVSNPGSTSRWFLAENSGTYSADRWWLFHTVCLVLC